jgi:hypothetical protein
MKSLADLLTEMVAAGQDGERIDVGVDVLVVAMDGTDLPIIEMVGRLLAERLYPGRIFGEVLHVSEHHDPDPGDESPVGHFHVIVRDIGPAMGPRIH